MSQEQPSKKGKSQSQQHEGYAETYETIMPEVNLQARIDEIVNQIAQKKEEIVKLEAERIELAEDLYAKGEERKADINHLHRSQAITAILRESRTKEDDAIANRMRQMQHQLAMANNMARQQG